MVACRDASHSCFGFSEGLMQGFFSGGTCRNGVPEPVWGNKIPKKQKLNNK
jgi:hypothetical protein